MISKNQIKRITALHQKKYRDQERLFIAEGVKVISELLHSGMEAEAIYASEDLSAEFPRRQIEAVSSTELSRISALSAANNCLAVFRMPPLSRPEISGLCVALDEVRDPGNLGTIIRLCDWFGVRQLICSKGTADVFNPKVVQATMGSLSRVKVSYVELEPFLKTVSTAVFGTFMDGANLYTGELPSEGIIVMGNEANGISAGVEQLCTQRISIPRFGDLRQTESLNVAMAASVVLSEFRRRTL